MYKHTWVPVIGEILVCHHERHNFRIDFDMATIKPTIKTTTIFMKQEASYKISENLHLMKISCVTVS